MKKHVISSCVTAFVALTATFSSTLFAVEAERFTPVAAPATTELMIKGHEDSLCLVANGAADYLSQHPEDSAVVHAGKGLPEAFTLERVKNTLRFICETAMADKESGQSRLSDPAFIQRHFQFYRWTPDKQTALMHAKKSKKAGQKNILNRLPDDQILLTKYYTKLIEAQEKPSPQADQALYALPFDEQGMTQEQADKQRATLTRFKYTRQDVINGVLLKNSLAKPLVWLSEKALHDVLLQGTGVATVNGKQRIFNVHRNNGIAYDYTLDKTKQPRYWYFAEVPHFKGYGSTIETKVPVAPQVTFAGDVDYFGLGKLIMLDYQVNGESQQRFGVMADHGGAFKDNQFQLDMLVDSYKGWRDYHIANKHLPDYVSAWLVLIKE